MKKFVGVQVAIIVITLVIGMVNKSTFENAGILDVKNASGVDALNCNISEMFTDDMYDYWSSNEFQTDKITFCKEAKNVVIVEPLDEIECYGMSMLQKVRVKKVIKGDIELDATIWISKSGGPAKEKIDLYEYDNDAPIYILNFADIMRTGNEYIAMLDEKQSISDYIDRDIYYGADDMFTYFALNNENKAINKNVCDVKLAELKNCDIFAQSEETLACIEQIKTEVLSYYNIEN